MTSTKGLKSILVTLLLLGISSGLFLYASGYRLERDGEGPVDLTQTGMVNAKSVPEGANVYVDGVLRTATDGTVSGIEPGFHTLSIVKNGFVTWNKNIEVFPELVTDITSILVSQSPRLEPLTNTGARQPTISPSLNKLAFFSKDGTAPGVWVIPLTGEALSLFRTNPYVVLEDIQSNFYSSGKTIEWAPEEDKLLVEDSNGAFFIVNLDNNVAEATASPELIREDWAAELLEKRTDFIERLDIPEELRDIAVAESTMWAPDDKKFLYTDTVDENVEYRVYNMEKPIPVGEKVETVAFTVNVNDPQPSVTWYADSFHLILAEGNIAEEQKGTVSILRIDGTNKTELYSNTLYTDRVFSSPGGDKVVILTSFKSGEQTDLYTIGIR
ncbi:PEGA domain-containing protein [candidate division WWE3 bacterium]|jgi:hypothetical protein|nr:PEGA domain-containing protein [candidate division WWE3 bacterium]